MSEKKYNPADSKSILRYAVQLEGKTFFEVIQDCGEDTQNTIRAYSNKKRKGGVGNLLEEVYFGYKANSNQEPDFSEAGVELKVTPYEEKKDGGLRAGERLVLTMIDYNNPVELDFYKSHAWSKMRQILLIYYLRDKMLPSNLYYKINFVRLFTPPAQDLEIIRQDYDTIVGKIKAGLDHELSESDTMYLGACTKGATAEKSTVPEYYGDKILARKRAFCFKNSYMTYVLNHYVAGDSVGENAILKDGDILANRSFADVLKNIMNDFLGKSDRELCQQFNVEYSKSNKALLSHLAYRILGVKNTHADEFEKANIQVKTIRINANGKNRESISFPAFKFKELVNEEFEDSAVCTFFEETQIFFVIWEEDGDVYRVKGCQLWRMPYDDLHNTVRSEWEEYKRIINQGVEFARVVQSSGKIVVGNNLLNKSDTSIIHIRPHAGKAAYRFADGFEIGNVEKDADELPNGEYMTKQCFWINNDYILLQLDCEKKVDQIDES